MARRKNGINKSEEIRKLLSANPKVSSREVIDDLNARGIKISPKLYYLVKGKMLGRQAHKRKAHKMAAKVVHSAGGNADVLSTIRKVKALADELGGLHRLRALVEVMTA